MYFNFLVSIALLCLLGDFNTQANNTNGYIYSDDQFCLLEGKHGLEHTCTTYIDYAECTCTHQFLSKVLNNITNAYNITTLFICIDNRLNIEQGDNVDLDLSELERFVNLKKIVIKSSVIGSGSLLETKYNSSTFKDMKYLEYFQLNVPIYSTEIIKGMSHLKYLDLSYTLDIKLVDIFTWIANQGTKLKILKLENVQTLGYHQYSMSINLTEIVQNKTLENITVIDISKNSIIAVYPGLSQIFPNLERIYTSNNMLVNVQAISAFIEILMWPGIKVIDIANQGCQGKNQLPSSYHIENTENPIRLQKRILPYSLDLLHILGIDYMDIECLNEASGGNLSRVLNDSIRTCQFIKCLCGSICAGVPCKIFPTALEIINLEGDCMFHMNLPISKTLQSLNMSNLQWSQRNASTFINFKNVCFGENSLQEFSVANNVDMLYSVLLAKALDHVTFVGLNKIEVFNISANALSFDLGRFCHSKQSFENSLTHLFLADNFIEVNAKSQPCLTCARNLKVLDLSHNNLTYIPIQILASCKELSSVSFAGNHLDFSKSSMNLSAAIKLEILDLSDNSVQYMSREFRQSIEELVLQQEKHNKTLNINLQSNPLSCACRKDIVEFISWMQTTKVQFKNKGSYTCNGVNGIEEITRVNIEEYKKRCFPSPFFTIVLTTSASFGTMIIFSLMFLAYFKRYTLKYYIFRIHQLFLNKKNPDTIPSSNSAKKRHKYDVFVSYCAKDRFWVHDVLMKKLENVYNFRLCIHYRDFPAGGSISDVIVKKLNQSNELIFVLSDNYIEALRHSKRAWFQYELDEACDLARLRRKNIIVIRLGKITSSVSDRNLAYLLESGNIFLQWPENRTGEKVFWAKLVSDIYGDTNNSCLSCCFNTRKKIGHQDVSGFSKDPFEVSSDEEEDNNGPLNDQDDNGEAASDERKPLTPDNAESSGNSSLCCFTCCTTESLDDDYDNDERV